MANSDMKEVIKLERKIYEEMKAREDALRQRESDETADMFNERELARLQAKYERLREFVESISRTHIFGVADFILQEKAAALLASVQATTEEDSDDAWQRLSGVERLALRYAYDNGLVNSASNLGMFADCLRGLDDKGYLRPCPHVESGLLTDYKLTDIGKDLVEGEAGDTP